MEANFPREAKDLTRKRTDNSKKVCPFVKISRPPSDKENVGGAMRKQSFCSILLTTLVANGFAQSNCETSINCTVTTSSSAEYTGMPSDTASPGTALMPTENSGAYTQATSGRNQSTSTMMTALGMGASFAAQCGTFNKPACVLAGAAFAAASLAGQARSGATQVMRELGADDAMIAASEQDGVRVTDTSLQSQLNQGLADLSKNGYALDSQGNITLPNGSSVNGDLSAQSMTAAGMGSGDINSVQAGLDRMKKELDEKSKKMGEDGSGNGSGGDLLAASQGSTGYNRVSISSLDKDGSSGANGNVDAERKGIDRDPSAWQGFYKQFGDSVIGVAHSDIFLMVEKRVERERIAMGH